MKQALNRDHLAPELKLWGAAYLTPLPAGLLSQELTVHERAGQGSK